MISLQVILTLVSLINIFSIQNNFNFSCKMLNCKVETHLHLESGISLEHLLKLIQKYEPERGIHTITDVDENIKFTNFKEFLVNFKWIKNLLRTKEDFYELTFDLLKRLSSKGVIYVELSYEHITRNLTTDLNEYEITKSIIEAAIRARELFNINSNFLLLIHRGENQFKFMEKLNSVKEFINIPAPRLAGISIAGVEKGADKYSAHNYVKLAESARSLGLNITVHSGEDGGPEEIWETIRNIKPDRIAHVTKSVRDKSLLNYFKESHIPIEICVVSNVKSGALHGPMSSHPIKYFYEMGLNVSFNSDDPFLFKNYIDDEMNALVETFGFSNEDIEKMFRNALDYSFLSRSERDEIKNLCESKCKEEL